jgi:signal transduction histidine kinase
MRDWLASFRLRLLFRGAFVLLILTVLAMTVVVLQDEKQRSHDHYRTTAEQTMAHIVARLRHPAGQLALLNPELPALQEKAVQPVLLPYSALDFDDQNKVRNAVEVAGCVTAQSPWCVGVGNTPWTGGFVYAVGRLTVPTLVPHALGDERLDAAHRLRVTLTTPTQTVQWVAPFERLPATALGSQRGRFTGYVTLDGGNYKGQKPVREFRGWGWQALDCPDAPPDVPPDAAPAADCAHPTWVSLRLPVQAWQDALFQKERPAWPPADLAQHRVRVELLPPGEGPALFDSEAVQGASRFTLRDLSALLLPGESLAITRQGQPWQTLTGQQALAPASPLLLRLIGWLPVQRAPWWGAGAAMDAVEAVHLTEVLDTPSGRFELNFSGDARSVNRALGEVATRLSWFVGAMLLAMALVWLAMEVWLMRPLARLTRRTRGLWRSVQTEGGLERFDLADLRGRDEMGLLATALDELLHRVREDASRERIRAQQEKDMWHAVGHEIMSPLQSLLALHASPDDGSHRYIQRMQQAVRVLYGTARPSEAFESTRLTLDAVDLAAFVRHVADNAGVAGLRAEVPPDPVPVRADEYPLEDVFSHILRNAERHRQPGTPITLSLVTDDATATVGIHNVGPHIAPEMLATMFEYGVSDQPTGESRGQGLFVVRTYMAKMGGTVTACNVTDGVRFDLCLQRLRG